MNPSGSTSSSGAPRAGYLSHFYPKAQRRLRGPRSVHASHGSLFKSHDHTDCSIPKVLFLGSCRPDCTLSHHATTNNTPKRPPRRKKGDTESSAHPSLCWLQFRRPAGDPVVSDPSWQFSTSVADGLLEATFASTASRLTVFTRLALEITSDPHIPGVSGTIARHLPLAL